MRELVRHEHDGLLFPRGDSRALAAALLRLSRDPELCSRLADARTEPLTLADVAASIEALYAGLTRRSGPRTDAREALH